jgi:Cu(I)/Ag(I) efflux system membrane fusion protein
MFVTATIEASLTHEGRAAPTGVEGRYSCPMHPQVLADAPGSCPVCEMPLEQIPGGSESAPAAPAGPRFMCPMKCEGDTTYADPDVRCPVCHMKLEVVSAPHATNGAGVLAIPVSAVLDSGTRRIAYVEKSRGLFEPRELVLGPRAGAWFSVLSGVVEGERVATRGNFLIDSQFQITGQPSLFYPGGLHEKPSAHAH